MTSAPLLLFGLADTPNGGWLVAAFSIIVVIVVGVIAIVIVDRRGLDFHIDIKGQHGGFARRSVVDPETARLQVAMARLGDLEQAIVATISGAEAEREAKLARFFTYLCGNLAEVLAVGTLTRYRVSIWINDDQDAQYLRLIAMHGFDRNDPEMQHLERKATVAGWAIDNRAEYYVRDCSSDAIYRARRRTPTYRSMIAVPLGSGDPWSVMTVDASVIDGLTEGQRNLIRRFGAMATTVAKIDVET